MVLDAFNFGLNALALPIQKAPAQQRQFLHCDSIPARKSEIGAHSKERADLSDGYTFKGENSVSRVLREPCQDELH